MVYEVVEYCLLIQLTVTINGNDAFVKKQYKDREIYKHSQHMSDY